MSSTYPNPRKLQLLPVCETNPDHYYGALHCPRCGDLGWLHHGTVSVFSRSAEDGVVIRTDVTSNAGVYVEPGSWQGNPSSRRDGIVIDFSCEHCGDGLELTIAQHKGQTYMEWRILHD